MFFLYHLKDHHTILQPNHVFLFINSGVRLIEFVPHPHHFWAVHPWAHTSSVSLSDNSHWVSIRIKWQLESALAPGSPCLRQPHRPLTRINSSFCLGSVYLGLAMLYLWSFSGSHPVPWQLRSFQAGPHCLFQMRLSLHPLIYSRPPASRDSSSFPKDAFAFFTLYLA